jgi:hypothetical protein
MADFEMDFHTSISPAILRDNRPIHPDLHSQANITSFRQGLGRQPTLGASTEQSRFVDRRTEYEIQITYIESPSRAKIMSTQGCF